MLNSMGMGETFFPSVSRANRDIRFSKDKSPYKDRMWTVFNYGEGRWQENAASILRLHLKVGVQAWIL